jgi:hypothetical protein
MNKKLQKDIEEYKYEIITTNEIKNMIDTNTYNGEEQWLNIFYVEQILKKKELKLLENELKVLNKLIFEYMDRIQYLNCNFINDTEDEDYIRVINSYINIINSKISQLKQEIKEIKESLK